jgi:hypothetical protein
MTVKLWLAINMMIRFAFSELCRTQANSVLTLTQDSNLLTQMPSWSTEVLYQQRGVLV